MSPAPPRRLPESDRRVHALRAYVTADEQKAVDTLALQYGGTSRLVREALALLVRTKHPELLLALRKDLTNE